MSRDTRAIFAAVDALDADAFVSHLTEDVTFCFANSDPVVGRPAVREAVAEFLSSIDGLSHTFRNTWVAGDTMIVELEVEYLRKDGKTLTLSNVDILDFEGDLVRSWRIYIDIAPVYA